MIVYFAGITFFEKMKTFHEDIIKMIILLSRFGAILLGKHFCQRRQTKLSEKPRKMMTFYEFFDFDHKKIFYKKMNFFRKLPKSSKKLPKVLGSHASVCLYSSGYLFGSISSF